MSADVPSGSRLVPLVIFAGVAAVLALGGALVRHAESSVNKVALSDAPRPVSVVAAVAAPFRDSRRYVGTLRPWIEAEVGPQFISAYVDTVLVRPGAAVKRGEVLATLDCRNASAQSRAVAAEARALDERQKEIADESTRVRTLLDGGFVSIVEAEQKRSQASAEEAQVAAQRAKLASTILGVDDCVLRAPFDGEVAVRTIDPGAFARPGAPIVSVVDRSTVRMTIDVPESDFTLVGAGTPVTIRVVATGMTVAGAVSRRAPSAAADTRTVHVEVDVPNAKREIPVNTTAEATVEVGQPAVASAVPLSAATVTGEKAGVFVVEDGVAHKRSFPVVGEQGADLLLDGRLRPGTLVVTEGQFALKDGERVAPSKVAYAPAKALGATAGAENAP